MEQAKTQRYEMKTNLDVTTLEQILSPDSKQKLIRSESDWITEVKNKSFNLLTNQGLPTKKNEKWKYTDISQIYKYNLAPDKPETSLSLDKISNLLPRKMFPVNLIFVNGFFFPGLSNIETLPAGITIKSISQAIDEEDPILKKHLVNSANLFEDSFVNLNNLFLENGVFIHIKKNIEINSPIHIIYMNTQDKEFSSQHPRNLIIAENGAKVSILEEFHGKEIKPAFINHLTEIFVDNEADLSHYLLQNNSNNIQISTLSAIQKKSSKFSSQVITLGGELIRNNIHSKLIGDRSSCLMNGVYIIDETQHLDNNTSIDHINPNCDSSQLYHGILSDKSRGVFTGKINVNKNAQNTISTQTNRSLMLSDDAHIDTLPQLEIFNDDVKCSHGATIGQLDEDSLYYLRSRGIDFKTARKMLTLAFSHKITEQYENKDIRDKVEELIVNRMDSLEGSEK